MAKRARRFLSPGPNLLRAHTEIFLAAHKYLPRAREIFSSPRHVSAGHVEKRWHVGVKDQPCRATTRLLSLPFSCLNIGAAWSFFRRPLPCSCNLSLLLSSHSDPAKSHDFPVLPARAGSSVGFRRSIARLNPAGSFARS